MSHPHQGQLGQYKEWVAEWFILENKCLLTVSAGAHVNLSLDLNPQSTGSFSQLHRNPHGQMIPATIKQRHEVK